MRDVTRMVVSGAVWASASPERKRSGIRRWMRDIGVNISDSTCCRAKTAQTCMLIETSECGEQLGLSCVGTSVGPSGPSSAAYYWTLKSLVSGVFSEESPTKTVNWPGSTRQLLEATSQ